MSEIFALASQQSKWLESRRLAIASNIANANTPGYRALDVPAFSAAVESAKLELTRTAGSHLDQSGPGNAPAQFDIAEREHADAFHSGNNVNVEQEFIASGEVARSHALNAAIVRSFHRMLLASAKGQP